VIAGANPEEQAAYKKTSSVLGRKDLDLWSLDAAMKSDFFSRC
jgi:hypothetical protein